MVKIVNGQIVSEGANEPKSPFAHLKTDRPRRGSIQELQLAEQLKEQQEQSKVAQESQTPVCLRHNTFYAIIACIQVRKTAS